MTGSSPPFRNTGAPLIEGLDYYMDGPYVVFTAHFLLKRGYCCQSGCRHCPYEFKKTSLPAQPDKKPSGS